MKKQIILIIVSFSVIAVLVSFFGRSNPNIRSVDKSLWVRHWDQLNLAHIKAVYQPYTVAEMIDLWDDKLIVKYRGAERFKQTICKACEVYPTLASRLFFFNKLPAINHFHGLSKEDSHHD